MVKVAPASDSLGGKARNQQLRRVNSDKVKQQQQQQHSGNVLSAILGPAFHFNIVQKQQG